MEHAPVTTLADLATLDKEEVLEGYADGLNDEPEPGNNRSRSYQHGWLNGAVDKGRRPISAEQRALARLVVRSWRKFDA